MNRRLVGGATLVALLTLVGLRAAQSRGAEPAAPSTIALHLMGGKPGREALVQAFVAALESRDTAALGAMLMSPEEFASLYYPTTPQALPPYELPADLMWFTMSTRSHRDLGIALDELGGRPFGYRSHRCAADPRVEGENRIWGYCEVDRQVDGRLVVERPFGLIIERDGVFKFVSYANRLH